MYDLLVEASARTPIVDNEQGSLITMRSVQGLIFGYVGLHKVIQEIGHNYKQKK
jgi:hypothetical protein